LLKKFFLFFLLFIVLFISDQYIKTVFVNGFEWHSNCISLVLAYNKGVAFSFFEFLGPYLKYIQIVLFLAIVIYLTIKKEVFFKYYIALSFLFAGGISNILDRFLHEGVVDYVYWHCWFDFAIFNLADVFIDISIAIILLIQYKNQRE